MDNEDRLFQENRRLRGIITGLRDQVGTLELKLDGATSRLQHAHKYREARDLRALEARAKQAEQALADATATIARLTGIATAAEAVLARMAEAARLDHPRRRGAPWARERAGNGAFVPHHQDAGGTFPMRHHDTAVVVETIEILTTNVGISVLTPARASR
jgi:hypothetical protein